MRFTTRSALTATILAAALATGTASAQTQADHAAHHSGNPPAAGNPATPAGPQAGMMGGSGMMGGGSGMMGGGSGMMGMMRMMHDTSMMQMPMGPGGMGGIMSLLSANDLDGRLAYLRTELKITDAQAAQWNAFADTLRGAANALQGARTPLASTDKTTAADWIDHQASLMSARAEALKTLADAERSLSPVLTDEQKKLADQLLTGGLPGTAGHRI